MRRYFVVCRAVPELLGELVERTLDLEVEVVDPAGRADPPALVAPEALELAEDGRDRIGREAKAAGGVEPVDRLQQAQLGDLPKVVPAVAPVAEAPGQRPGEPAVLEHELLSRGRFARAEVLRVQGISVELDGVPGHGST